MAYTIYTFVTFDVIISLTTKPRFFITMISEEKRRQKRLEDKSRREEERI